MSLLLRRHGRQMAATRPRCSGIFYGALCSGIRFEQWRACFFGSRGCGRDQGRTLDESPQAGQSPNEAPAEPGSPVAKSGRLSPGHSGAWKDDREPAGRICRLREPRVTLRSTYSVERRPRDIQDPASALGHRAYVIVEPSAVRVYWRSARVSCRRLLRRQAKRPRPALVRQRTL